MSAAIARELRRRYVLARHVILFGEAACPIGGCATCARVGVFE